MNHTVKGQLARLKSLALRPLWTETALYRARRRCRTLIATPFAALAGLAWGVLSAPIIGVGSPILWGGLGAFSFVFFMHLEQLLIPPLAALARRFGLGSGAVAVGVWEVAVVGGLVYLVTGVFEAPQVPAAGIALGVGAFYALVMEYVLCGSAATSIASMLQSGGRMGAPVADQYSHADAMVARGEYDEAVRLYQKAIERNPHEGAPYIRMARALVKQGSYEEALATLSRCLRSADLPPDQETFVVHQIQEISSTKLGQPELAFEHLQLLLARHPTGQYADWAKEALREIESGLLPSATGESDESAVQLSTGDATGFKVDLGPHLEVDKGFEVPTQYVVGDDFVLEDDSSRPRSAEAEDGESDVVDD